MPFFSILFPLKTPNKNAFLDFGAGELSTQCLGGCRPFFYGTVSSFGARALDSLALVLTVFLKAPITSVRPLFDPSPIRLL